MCLMQTDFPVPDGPRIIEIWLSGSPRLSPFSTRLRPNAFTTSMNSTASSEPCSRLRPVCHWYSSASACEPRSCVRAPEDLRPHHSYEMDHHGVQHHRFRRRGPDSHRASARVVAVVAPDEHDHGRHRHALDQAVEEV